MAIAGCASAAGGGNEFTFSKPVPEFLGFVVFFAIAIFILVKPENIIYNASEFVKKPRRGNRKRGK